jgi:hypothetical protein
MNGALTTGVELKERQLKKKKENKTKNTDRQTLAAATIMPVAVSGFAP